MARVSILLALVAAACSDPECDVEDLVARDIESLHAIECGVIDVGLEVETPELEVAHDCVQEALDSRAPFYVVWRFTGFEGWVTQAYVGRGDDVAVTMYSRSPAPDGSEGTARISCSTLVGRAECDRDMLTGDLCFECVDRESAVLCESD